MKKGYEVKVASIPGCDLCASQGIQRAAYADAKLSIGPWAYVCQEHYAAYRCSLGVGHGQKLLAR